VKFAIHTLVFYGLDTLRLMVQNTGALVDKIYLSHSKKPWTAYNEQAAVHYESNINERFIDDFPFREKIVWLEGEWRSEEDQRNHSLKRARADGMDYMIIQDADEFYLESEFLANLQAIRANPNYPAYRCPWTVFWKTTGYVLNVRQGNTFATVTTCPNFAVNVNMPDVKFSSRRLVNRIQEAYMLPGLCLHLAWVLSDAEVLQKIETWGHSHQFDRMAWYRHKWKAWKPSIKYIGHISRANYLGAVPFKGILPPELQGLFIRGQQYEPLTIRDQMYCWYLDMKSRLRTRLSELLRGHS